MNIVKFSNILNLIAQQHPSLQNYHFGFESDINRSWNNNFNPVGQNEVGKLFPCMILEPPNQRTTAINNNDAEWDIVLNFFDTPEYDNNANATTNTLVEEQNNLQIIVNDVVKALQKWVKESTPTADRFFFVNISAIPLPYQHNDKTLQIQVTFLLKFKAECSSFDFDFAAIDPAFNYPVDSNDYEKIVP